MKRSFMRRPSDTELRSVAGRTTCYGWHAQFQTKPVTADVFTASAGLARMTTTYRSPIPKAPLWIKHGNSRIIAGFPAAVPDLT